MPRSSPVAGIARLVGHHADIARRDQRRVLGLARDLRAGLDAGVHVHDLDIIAVLVDPISPRGQDLAEDAAISLLVDQVGPLGQRLADLGDQHADLAGRDDLVLDELGLVLQGRVEVPAGSGHGLEDADLERAAGGVGLHQGALGRLRHPAERPRALVADQEAVSRRDLDAADRPLPDAEVTDHAEEDDGQKRLGRGAQRLRWERVHGWSSSEMSAGDATGRDDDGPAPATACGAGPSPRATNGPDRAAG